MRSAPFYNFLLEAALGGSLLILAMLFARRYLRGRIGSRILYFAWLLAALRLLLPISLPNPFIHEIRPTLSSNIEVRPIADQVRVRFTDAAMDLAFSGLTGGYKTPAGSFFVEMASLNERGKLGGRLLLGYGAVAAGVAAYMLCRNILFFRRLKKGRVEGLSQEAQQRYAALCKKYRVKPVPVYFADPLPGPCMVGVLRPRIVLPLTLNELEMEQALAHELCHVKARDGLWGLVRNICCAVHWFNPLVWLAAFLSRIDCELACDDRVTAGMDAEQKLLYAQTLVKTAQRGAPSFTVVATCMSMKGKQMKKRITAIVASPKVRRSLAAAFALVAAAMLFTSFATAELDAGAGQEADAAFVPYYNRRYALSQEADARAYAGKFFDDSFITGSSAQNIAIGESSGEWVATISLSGDAPDAKLRFDKTGVVLSYKKTKALGPLTPSEDPYDDRVLSEGHLAIINELDRFCRDQLPGISYESLALESDMTDGTCRYVTFITGNAYVRPAHQFVVQAEPELKLVSFELASPREMSVYGDPVQEQTAVAVEQPLSEYVQALIGQSGPFMTWSYVQKAGLSYNMPRLMAQYKDNLGDVHLLTQVRDHAYGLPDGDADISTEDALLIARHELAVQYSLEQKDFEGLQAHYSFYVDDPEAPVWHVLFVKGDALCYDVAVASRTGKVVAAFDRSKTKEGVLITSRQVMGQDHAEALARWALTKYMNFSREWADSMLLVSAEYQEYNSILESRGIAQPFWSVGFIEPGSGHSMDYCVLLEAATGRVLVVYDPSNISNG